jgi:hypothetical protein
MSGVQSPVSDLVKSARLFANESHDRFSSGRVSALQNLPAHLKSVAQIVSSVTDNHETIAAAWLHDLVEDTAVTLGDLERRFGPHVAKLVSEITIPFSAAGRTPATHLALAKEQLAQASPAAKTIKLADLIDTCSELHKSNPVSLIAYASEADELAAVLEGGDQRLLARLRRNLQKYAQDSLPSQSVPGSPRFTPLAVPVAALRVFEHAVTAQYVAEPLVSFGPDLAPAELSQMMTLAGIEVAGLHRNNQLWGFVEGATLRNRDNQTIGKEFPADAVVNARSSLVEVIDVLTRHDRCFVSAGKKVIGIISRNDLHKPAVRMWLFGIITVVEQEATERIRQKWPDGSWTQRLTEQRVAKAEELHAERMRRKDNCQLVDCLQLSDKVAILMSSDSALAALGFSSASGAQKAGQQIESLRNKLAHSQDFVDQDWPQVVRLARRIHQILD